MNGRNETRGTQPGQKSLTLARHGLRTIILHAKLLGVKRTYITGIFTLSAAPIVGDTHGRRSGSQGGSAHPGFGGPPAALNRPGASMAGREDISVVGGRGAAADHARLRSTPGCQLGALQQIDEQMLFALLS